MPPLNASFRQADNVSHDAAESPHDAFQPGAAHFRASHHAAIMVRARAAFSRMLMICSAFCAPHNAHADGLRR